MHVREKEADWRIVSDPCTDMAVRQHTGAKRRDHRPTGALYKLDLIREMGWGGVRLGLCSPTSHTVGEDCSRHKGKRIPSIEDQVNHVFLNQRLCVSSACSMGLKQQLPRVHLGWHFGVDRRPKRRENTMFWSITWTRTDEDLGRRFEFRSTTPHVNITKTTPGQG